MALTLLLGTLGVVYLLAAVPLLELYAARERTLDDHRMMLPRLQVSAERLPELRAQVAELRDAAGTRRVTIDGASDAIASANLQSRIEGLAASAGASISSTESLPAETHGGYRRIGLRFVLSGSYETLVRLLAKLEAATPPLIIDNLQIHGVLRRPGMRAATGPEAGLDAGLEVYGFRNNDSPAAAKP